MTKKKLDPEALAASNERRNARWRHGACFGHVEMAMKNMAGVASSPTVSAKTAEAAWQVHSQLMQLRELLRSDQDALLQQ